MTTALIKPLSQLFNTGTINQATEPDLTVLLSGLAHPSNTDNQKTQNWVISQRLLQTRQQLTTDQEAVAAILATQPEIRQPWLAILAARVKEAGHLNDSNSQIQLISRLNGAAHWVEAAWNDASLNATPINELERTLWGVTAEQAQATPILVRVIATASQLVTWQTTPLPEINPTDTTGKRPDINWCQGRLLAIPQHTQSDHYLLNGTWPEAEQDTMRWVLSTPWAYLLASIVYAQDAWAAEARGGLLLELPAGQQAYHPSEIQVLVAANDGVEVLCGTLGEFILKMLSHLNMGLFPDTPSSTQINNQLTPLISLLLQQKIWRFQHGLSGEQGFYQIHPLFSDLCYRIAGSRSFGRYGQAVWRAIRIQAEQWYHEKRGQVSGGRVQEVQYAV